MLGATPIAPQSVRFAFQNCMFDRRWPLPMWNGLFGGRAPTEVIEHKANIFYGHASLSPTPRAFEPK